MEILLRRSCGGFVAVNPFLTNRATEQKKNSEKKFVFRMKSPNCHRLLSVRAGADRISSFVFNSKALCANDDDENVEYVRRSPQSADNILYGNAEVADVEQFSCSAEIIQMPKCNNGVEVIRRAA